MARPVGCLGDFVSSLWPLGVRNSRNGVKNGHFAPKKHPICIVNASEAFWITFFEKIIKNSIKKKLGGIGDYGKKGVGNWCEYEIIIAQPTK